MGQQSSALRECGSGSRAANQDDEELSSSTSSSSPNNNSSNNRRTVTSRNSSPRPSSVTNTSHISSSNSGITRLNLRSRLASSSSQRIRNQLRSLPRSLLPSRTHSSQGQRGPTEYLVEGINGTEHDHQQLQNLESNINTSAAAIAENISNFFTNTFENQYRSRRRSWQRTPTNFFGGIRGSPDEQANMLSQLLSVAAAATAASLNRHRDGLAQDPDRHVDRVTSQDNGFDEFISLLQQGRLLAALRGDRQAETGVAEMPTGEGPQVNMFRMFRFGSITTTSNSVDTPELVPVIIVGIRSVTAGETEITSTQREELIREQEQIPFQFGGPTATSSIPSDNEPRTTHPLSAASFNPLSATSSNPLSAASSDPLSAASSLPLPLSSMDIDPTIPLVNTGRSWIIYVVGGTYPPNHPILTTPSLFTDNPTYEDMLMLDMLAHVRPPVTTQDAIDKSQDSEVISVSELVDEVSKCQICLSDYQEDEPEEKLRILSCKHVFHKECVDRWLTEGSNKCPLCRDVVIKPRSA